METYASLLDGSQMNFTDLLVLSDQRLKETDTHKPLRGGILEGNPPSWRSILTLDPEATNVRAFALSDTPMLLTCDLKKFPPAQDKWFRLKTCTTS